MKIINRIAAAIVPLLLAVGLAVSVSSDTHAAEPEPTLWLLEHPCHFEDSSNCYWDASTTGNQSGHSFVARYVKQAKVTCILYLDRGYARTHDKCIDEGHNPRMMQDLDGDGYGAETARSSARTTQDERPCFSRSEFKAIRAPATRKHLERVTDTTNLAVPDPHPTTLADGSEVDNWFYPDCRFHDRLLIQVTYLDGMWDIISYPSRTAVRAGYAPEV